MDFNNFFRKFFSNNEHERDTYFETDDIQSRRNNIFFEDSFERFNSPNDMFQHVEDMFNKMLSPFGMLGFPTFKENMPNEPNPRNIMLKDSDEKNSSSHVNEFGSGLQPDNSGKETLRVPHAFSFSKFSSIKTVHLPDGTVEEHRTTIDSDGNKISKIRRAIGDTSHEVITKSDKQGIKEKEENFMNMAEDELSDFDKRWRNLDSNTNEDPETKLPSLSLPPSSPTYLYFLKKLFGSSQKESLKWC